MSGLLLGGGVGFSPRRPGLGCVPRGGRPGNMKMNPPGFCPASFCKVADSLERGGLKVFLCCCRGYIPPDKSMTPAHQKTSPYATHPQNSQPRPRKPRPNPLPKYQKPSTSSQPQLCTLHTRREAQRLLQKPKPQPQRQQAAAVASRCRFGGFGWLFVWL